MIILDEDIQVLGEVMTAKISFTDGDDAIDDAVFRRAQLVRDGERRGAVPGRRRGHVVSQQHKNTFTARHFVACVSAHV